ncbi:MAG: DNA repair protein RecN [Gammaproteobacteria bacterium]|nr:DNA repair protein RecN [Gammaproteobacteria bacterium]
MLRQLTIRDLAVIDRLELCFAPGFAVLTGETGAGKSILIDALGLALGTRGDAATVRAGRPQAEVVAEFELHDADTARGWLIAQDLIDPDDPDRCVLRRLLPADGRSRAFVNDRPAALGALRELGEHLVEIFGQGESRTLMRVEVQRDLLDRYGAHDQALAATAQAAAELARVEREIKRLQQSTAHDPTHGEFLRFQLQELESLGLGDGELAVLESEHKRLANAGRLLEEGDHARQLLYGGETCAYDQLSVALNLLRGLCEFEPTFSAVAETVSGAQLQIDDAASSLRRLMDRFDLDPARLVEVERRLAAIHDLARKHRLRASELPALQRRLGEELRELAGAEQALQQLMATHATAETRYREICARLSAARRAAGPKLAQAVVARLRRLGLPHARVAVTLEQTQPAPVSAHGVDQVRFDFSANPGQPLRPLAKVASGGELSRLGLAIQVCAGGDTGIPTMVFDEIDAGIGGGVAEVVGAELRALSAHRQVLCVTHLPQVAAHGVQHFGIRKQIRGGQTFIRVEALDRTARIDELARMAGGREITDTATAHAREMLDKAGG